MVPSYWLQFVERHKLIGKTASLNEESDLSALGAEMQFLTEAQSDDELANAWPGIGVAGDGYVPVAWCSIGSGDYYYINSSDGPNGPLYRIYHDAVGPDGYDPRSAVERVLDRYEDVLRHVEP